MKKKNYYSYKTAHYYVKSVEVSDNPDILFTSVWNIYDVSSADKAAIRNNDNDYLAKLPVIGSFHFNGKQKMGCINLEYDFEQMTEVGDLKLIFSYICRWAFSQKDVYSVKTTFPQTKNYDDIFDYLAYKKENEEGTVTLHASKPLNTILYLVLGMIIGFILGAATANMKTGIIFGFVVCGGIGILMDSNYTRRRNWVENRD